MILDSVSRNHAAVTLDPWEAIKLAAQLGLGAQNIVVAKVMIVYDPLTEENVHANSQEREAPRRSASLELFPTSEAECRDSDAGPAVGW